MALLRYSDSWDYSTPSPRVMGTLTLLTIVGFAYTSAYDLWRDWQHHRAVWWHWVSLMMAVYGVALLCRAVHRVRQERAEKAAERQVV